MSDFSPHTKNPQKKFRYFLLSLGATPGRMALTWPEQKIVGFFFQKKNQKKSIYIYFPAYFVHIVAYFALE
jgi:hypothetical protein